MSTTNAHSKTLTEARARLWKLSHVINCITVRMERKKDAWCTANPGYAHEASSYPQEGFLTRREITVRHACKLEHQQLIHIVNLLKTGVRNYSDLSEKNKLTAIVSRLLRIRRAEVRQLHPHIEQLRAASS